jgi:hypothetical protein
MSPKLQLILNRHYAHLAFDQLWQGDSRLMTRSAAYQWLAENMGIPASECHIGKFDELQCRKVVFLCEQLMGVVAR